MGKEKETVFVTVAVVIMFTFVTVTALITYFDAVKQTLCSYAIDGPTTGSINGVLMLQGQGLKEKYQNMRITFPNTNIMIPGATFESKGETCTQIINNIVRLARESAKR